MRLHHQPEFYMISISPYNGKGWWKRLYMMGVDLDDRLSWWLDINCKDYSLSCVLPSMWDDDPEYDLITFNFKTQIEAESFANFMKKCYGVS